MTKRADRSPRDLGSSGSIQSRGSSGSIMSIGSSGSILSIGSAGSVLSWRPGPGAPARRRDAAR